MIKFIKENRSFVIGVVIVATLWLAFAYNTIDNNVNNRERFIELESSKSVNQHHIALKDIFTSIEIVDTFVQAEGIYNVTETSFEEFIDSHSFSNVDMISISIAPDGVIQFYHSNVESFDLIGLDLVNDERDHVREAIEYAIENKVIVTDGPFDLLLGTKGVVFRKPIFEDDEFVGIINFIVDYELLNDKFSAYDTSVIETGVYDENNELVFGETEYLEGFYSYNQIRLEYVDWHIGVHISDAYQRNSVILNSFLGLGFTIILIVGLTLWVIYYNRNKELLKTQKQLIYYDNLTSMPNRRLFEEKTLELIHNKESFFLGFGDLDNFKNINDVLGHSVGDQYLSFVSKKLESIDSSILDIYRWGGDEFIFVFKTGNKEELYPVIDRIFDEFKTPFNVKDTKHQISISIGFVRYPKDGNTIDELVKRADIVMYDIKAQHKNTYSFFEQKYLDVLYKELEFQQELEHYEINDFEIYLQPIIDVNTGAIRGFEGLSRLFNKEGKAFNTTNIIKFYEQEGAITKLDKYVFHQICKYMVGMDKLTSEKLFFTFNISPLSLTYDYIEYIERVVHSYKLDPSRIVIEIIETLGFKDVKISIELLDKMKRLGFKIAMDDFGMGYSSLSYIAKLPLDIIKIDRSFIHNYEKSEFNRTILRTIRDISSSLDLEILVEGVETKEQLTFITSLNAQYFQGYYHSKPMPFKEAKDIVKDMKKIR